MGKELEQGYPGFTACLASFQIVPSFAEGLVQPPPQDVLPSKRKRQQLPLKMEQRYCCGEDTATGGFSKSYVDIENEPNNGDSAEFVADNVEEGVVEKGKNAVESSTTVSRISKSHKRGRAPSNVDDSVLTDLSDQLKEIAVALK
nr:hypothetical protein CFP56_24215 [Quercus suber]